MTTIRTIIRNGRIGLRAPDEFSDGTEVLVNVTPVPPERIGIDETEWRDDPQALADWDAWIKTIEPIELTPEEQQSNARFDEVVRKFNIEHEE